MRLVRSEVAREVQHGGGAPGSFFLGDAAALLPGLIERHGGEAQTIYLDPPFATGQQFSVKVRVGEKDYLSGNGSLSVPAYADSAGEHEYLSMMRRVLEGARALLNDTGTIFLHIDHRMHAKLRLMMDEVFGEANFLNEIIWAYQTGGRARRYFSRKHDIILFYKKGRRYFFDIGAVAVPRDGNRRNHMKRHVDTDGRVYRSIRSGGKVYTYYDDEPVYPGDVWDDVSHLQQKDPQRTGYDTQKPLPLLNRIVRCASRPDDLVCDLFAGSGTTLEAARINGRRFLGADRSPMSLHVVRRRLLGAEVRYEAPACSGEPKVGANIESGIAYYDVTLSAYELEGGLTARALSGLDALDTWSVGYLRDGEFVAMAHAERSKAEPKLPQRLQLPVLGGVPMLRTQDVLGRYFYFAMEKDDPIR